LVGLVALRGLLRLAFFSISSNLYTRMEEREVWSLCLGKWMLDCCIHL